MFAEKKFTWDRTGGDPITQGNRNPLLYKNLGADGIKTGYLAVEKYSLASSISRNGRRLLLLVVDLIPRMPDQKKVLSYLLTVLLIMILLIFLKQKSHLIKLKFGRVKSIELMSTPIKIYLKLLRKQKRNY